MYNIRMGIPEMDSFWTGLCSKVSSGTANKDETILHRKLGKALSNLSQNPRHPGLESHEILSLSKRYGMKVWESYLENKTPKAGRIFWVYGPNRMDITIIGLEPHPEDKSNAYNKITLSSMGDPI
jgi:hypothetical protein